MFAGRGEQVPAALQNHGKAAAWKTSVAYLRKQSKLALFSPEILPSGENSASFDCFRRYATEVLHTAGPLGSHGFAAPRAIVLHALRTFMLTPVLELGRPTLATLESTAFLALGFGAVNGQDFPTRRDPLGRFTLFLISQLVSGSRVSLTQGRAGPAGVETAGREHGSCNHAVGE